MVIHSDLTSPFGSTRTRTVSFDTTHVAKGQGAAAWRRGGGGAERRGGAAASATERDGAQSEQRAARSAR